MTYSHFTGELNNINIYLVKENLSDKEVEIEFVPGNMSHFYLESEHILKVFISKDNNSKFISASTPVSDEEMDGIVNRYVCEQIYQACNYYGITSFGIKMQSKKDIYALCEGMSFTNHYSKGLRIRNNNFMLDSMYIVSPELKGDEKFENSLKFSRVMGESGAYVERLCDIPINMSRSCIKKELDRLYTQHPQLEIDKSNEERKDEAFIFDRVSGGFRQYILEIQEDTECSDTALTICASLCGSNIKCCAVAMGIMRSILELDIKVNIKTVISCHKDALMLNQKGSSIKIGKRFYTMDTNDDALELLLLLESVQGAAKDVSSNNTVVLTESNKPGLDPSIIYMYSRQDEELPTNLSSLGKKYGECYWPMPIGCCDCSKITSSMVSGHQKAAFIRRFINNSHFTMIDYQHNLRSGLTGLKSLMRWILS